MGHLVRGAAPMGGGTSSPPDQGAACFAGGGGCADPPEHGSSHFGEAQIVQLGVKIVFSSSSSWYHYEELEFKPCQRCNLKVHVQKKHKHYSWFDRRQFLFEMCWFYMGIAQIALDPPAPPLSNEKTWKKSASNHPGKPLHLRVTWE